MIEGALIAVVCFLLGVGVRSLPPRQKDPKPVEAVCGCGHHLSYHDPDTRACGYASRPVVYNSGGTVKYGNANRCPCLCYTGPEPLHTYIPVEIATEEGP